MPLSLLQWSHAQSNVETPARGDLRRRQGASMEPRSVERGNDSRASGPGRDPTASMEPRSVERGNPPVGRGAGGGEFSFNGATLSRTWKQFKPKGITAIGTVLQWSHAQSN